MKRIKLLSLIFLGLLLNSCGDNTTNPIITDVNTTNGMSIDTPPVIYSTELYTPSATVYYMDGTNDIATDNINWKISDSNIFRLSSDITVLPLKNEGNATLTAGYRSFKYFENSVVLNIVGITDINGTNKTWDIVGLDANTTGTHNLVAKGNFTDGTTNKTITRNIVWTSTGAAATISVDANYATSINITGVGNINITATLFGDANASITKTYNIN